MCTECGILCNSEGAGDPAGRFLNGLPAILAHGSSWLVWIGTDSQEWEQGVASMVRIKVSVRRKCGERDEV